MSAQLADLLGLDDDWRERALCAQTFPDEFFPEKGETTKHAKAICARCPVTAECLDFALTNEERYGVWGGLSERERRRLSDGMKPCRDCGTPIRRGNGNQSRCVACQEFRARCAAAALLAAREGSRPPDLHRWQTRPRPTIRRSTEGSGPVVAGTRGPDLTITPTTRTLDDDLAHAEQRRTWRNALPPLAPLPETPAPAATSTPRRERATTPTARPAIKKTVAPRPKVAGTDLDRRRGPRTKVRQDFVDLYVQGYTIPHIATVHGTYPKTVRAHLQRAGITLRDDRAGHSGGNNARTWTPTDLAAAAKAYLAGASIDDVAAQLHTGARQARAALEQAGVRIRPPAHIARRHTE